MPANGTKISQGPHILAASVGKLPILGENGDHVPAHYMMYVNGIISIVDSAPLFRLEELMTQNDEWAAAVEYLSAGSITDFDNTGRRLKGMLIGVAHQPDHSVRLRKEKE